MQIKNQFLLQWLEFTKGSESADSHFIWAGLSCVSACLGTRSKLIRGGKLKFTPNMYVILCGPAALRKSSAAKVGIDILEDYTEVKFGPHDTSGMRQGLIAAFQDAYGERPEVMAVKEHGADDEVLNALMSNETAEEKLMRRMQEMNEEKPKQKTNMLTKDDPRDLFVFADELASFIGMNQSELINCLTRLYYPEKKFEYKLSKTEIVLRNPALGLLACTTPPSLMKHMPEHAIGQGFSSRVVFVYSGEQKQKVFNPPSLDPEQRNHFGLLFKRISERSQDIEYTPEAFKMHTAIYNDYVPDIPDTRFGDYLGRRDEHLSKLILNLVAADERKYVTVDDILDAQIILSEAESLMTNALGELGLNKTSLCKQNMRDMIEQSYPTGVSMNVLRASAMRDMRTKQEFTDAINDFVAKKLCIVETVTPKSGNAYEMVLPIRDRIKKEKKVSREGLSRKFSDVMESGVLI